MDRALLKKPIKRTATLFRLAFGAALGVLVLTSPAQDAERRALDDAFFIANVRPETLHYPRISPADTGVLPAVARMLNDPLGDSLAEIHSRASSPISQLLVLVRKSLLDDAVDIPAGSYVIDDGALPEIPVEFRASIQRLTGAIQNSNTAIRNALSKLSESEQRALIESLPQWASNLEARFDFVKQKPLAMRDMQALLAKIDMSAIRRTAEQLSVAVERELATLKQLAASSSFIGKVEGRSSGVPFVLAGKGDDIHNERGAMLTIDLGGNDRYIGRHGAGIGYASAMLDLDGSDTYDVPDASIGVGLLGIGLAYDLGGSDTCRSKNLGFGAGLAGVGVWRKVGGDDDYRGGMLAQGFGYTGAGICQDTGGSDLYTIQAFGQGSARTKGVGWLIDQDGMDQYRALNQESFAQGASAGFFGWATDTPGGVGMLSDLKGQDTYSASDYAQGCGVGQAVGALHDAEGRDVYSGGRWCQASGNRAGAGYLTDLSGDDLYASDSGSCAFAGEESVAILRDKAGADRYVCLGPSIVTALPSGTALLIDGGGVDVFGARTGVAVGSGFALCLDLGSAYRMAEEFGQSKVLYDSGNGRYSVAGGTPEDDLPLIPPITATPNSATMPSPQELESIFAKASQRQTATNLQEIGEARNRLVSIGLNAAKWMIERKLSGATENERGVIGLVAKSSGQEAVNAVALAIASSDDMVAKGALRVCADFGIADAGALLRAASERPALLPDAIYTARRLKTLSLVPELMILAANQDRYLARLASEALAEIGDPGSAGTAQALLTSAEFPIRSSAFALLAKNPAAAYPIARALASSGVEAEARLGLELLGRLRSSEALLEASKGLKDSRPGVRLQALLALNGQFPKEALPQLAMLREDADMRVRLVAQSVEIGR